MSNTPTIEVIAAQCNGCGICVDICLFDAITKKEDTAIIITEKCKFCMTCISACPTAAIRVNMGI